MIMHSTSGWAGTWGGRGPPQLRCSKGLALTRGLVAVLISHSQQKPGRGKDRTSPEWYFQGQWVESPP